MNNTIPSVQAAIRVLEFLATHADGAAQSLVARELGTSSSTTYRILQTLAGHGWTRKLSGGLWCLSDGLLPVLLSYKEELSTLDGVRLRMQDAVVRHGIAMKLSIRRGLEQIVAARFDPDGPIQTTGHEGAVYPISEGSPGAALLADESEEGLRRIFDAARTSQTDFDYLVKSVVTIRRSGWCVRRRIAGWPIDGYSAPVRNRAGAVFAAVTLLQPSGRFADRTVVKLLKDVAMAS